MTSPHEHLDPFAENERIERSMKKRLPRPVIPAIIVGGGLVAAIVMLAFKPEIKSEARAPEAVLVDAQSVEPAPAQARIYTTGVLTASKLVNVMPEVTGKIVEQSPNLVPGGKLKKGELLVRVDPRPYRLVIQERQSQVQEAEVALEMEKSRGRIASEEWELLGKGKADDTSLALRGPQLRAAEEGVKAARSALDRARLDLERTALYAPFDALVYEEHADVGQFVAPGSSLATIISTDRFWSKASVEVAQLALMELPGLNSENASAVEIVHDLANGQRIVREGQVLGLAGGLDPQTRTAQVLIGVDNPLNPPEGGYPLLPGAYVELAIKGISIPSAFEIPRRAIFDGNKVWTVGEGEHLVEKTITIGWGDKNEVYATAGLNSGDRLVTSSLSMPVEGMAVKVRAAGSEGESERVASDGTGAGTEEGTASAGVGKAEPATL
ncbi:efflux RND transporter periplasmic adaptor subunit [bacterium]|nr:efflux RND transporter periplasmic adaptor subunit [bacterium]